MEMPEWRAEYTVGVPEIDRQHKYLFGLGARLGRVAQTERNQDELAGILSELVAYANEHFAYKKRSWSSLVMTTWRTTAPCTNS